VQDALKQLRLLKRGPTAPERREVMKRVIFILGILTLFISAIAFAQIKPCEELKAEIEAKLKAKGVTNYTLEIVPNDQVKDQKVVGSCDGGTKKIIYIRK
jgi:hypothetical protein